MKTLSTIARHLDRMDPNHILLWGVVLVPITLSLIFSLIK